MRCNEAADVGRGAVDEVEAILQGLGQVHRAVHGLREQKGTGQGEAVTF